MAQTFVEQFKMTNGTPVATTDGGITCDYISVKNAHRVTIVVDLLQAASHTTALTVNVATSVAAAGATAMVATVPIWKNADISSTDTLVRGTDAVTVLATAGATNQQLVMEIPIAKLAAGYDCIAAILDNSSQANNYAVVNYFIETRYPQATPPTAIDD